MGTDKGRGAPVFWSIAASNPTRRSECPAGCDRCQRVAQKLWCHWAQQRGKHHWKLSMQNASCHGDGVCIFKRGDAMQASKRGETGLFIVAAKPLISDSAHPRHALFLIFLSFYWSHICFSLSNFLFSAQQLRLCQEDWYKMSQGLMGFVSCIPPDHKQTLHICRCCLIPKQV